MVFGLSRKKKQDDADPAVETARLSSEVPARAEPATVGDAVTASGSEETAPTSSAGVTTAVSGTPDVASSAYDRSTLGPFDATEQDTTKGYIDLGAVRIKAAEGLQLRLEVEERTKRVIAATLDLGGSTLQLQAFAAPKTEGLWDEIRSQIGVSVGSQGGTVEERAGRLGTELIAKLPAQTPDGQPGVRVARFVGINGPRWFLRGVFGGPAAIDPGAAAPVERLFRNVVVVRGDHPLPPRELLPLKLPKDAAAAPPPLAPAQPDLNPLQRGPEITETR